MSGADVYHICVAAGIVGVIFIVAFALCFVEWVNRR